MRLLSFATALVLVPAVMATPTDFQFKDLALGAACQAAGILGKFNVVVEQAHAMEKVTITLRGVEPLDALHVIAKSRGLVVTKVRYTEGTTTTTYMVGSPNPAEAIVRTTRSYHLRYAPAAYVAKALGEGIEAATGARPAVDTATNTISYTGTGEVLDALDRAVADWDRPRPSTSIDLTLQEAGAKPRVLWTGTAKVTQGTVSKVETKPSGTNGADWRLAKLDGKLAVRISEDGFHSLDVNLSASMEKKGGGGTAKWSTTVQVANETEAVVGRIEVAPGETVELTVKPHMENAPKDAGPAGEGTSPAPGKTGGDLDLEGI